MVVVGRFLYFVSLFSFSLSLELFQEKEWQEGKKEKESMMYRWREVKEEMMKEPEKEEMLQLKK